MKGYFSLISGFLLPVLQLLIIQRCITILLGSGNRKIAGMMAWFLYYAFLVTAGLGILFPPQFLLLGNILMIFVISTVTRKKKSEKTLYQYLAYLYSMDAGRGRCVTSFRSNGYKRKYHCRSWKFHIQDMYAVVFRAT